MPKIPPDEELPGNPTTTKRDSLRDADDAHGIRALTKPATHGDDVDETVRITAAAQRQTERGRRLERVRGELAGPARTPSRARPKPTTDAAVLLPDVATLSAVAPGLRADRLEARGGFEAAPAGGELAEEVVADERRRSAQGFGGEMGGVGVAEL